MRKNTTHNLTVAAMLSAVAFILMFIEFPIPMLIPSFVKMDFSDLPALLGAFALGPVYGVVISFMKNLLHIVIKGTSTACVGELCNFMLGAVFSAVAGFIYKHRKSRKTAILGAIAGAAAMAVFSVPSNYFITYPAYVEFYHMPLEAILGMYQAILPSANSLIKCLVSHPARPQVIFAFLFSFFLLFFSIKQQLPGWGCPIAAVPAGELFYNGKESIRPARLCPAICRGPAGAGTGHRGCTARRTWQTTRPQARSGEPAARPA